MTATVSDHSSKGRPLLRVGDLARATGKTVRAIHLYEELGLLRPSARSAGGFRLYEPSAAARVRWIDLLHGLGFSLQEMREVLLKWWGAERAPDAMDELRHLFTRKLDETRAAIERHRQLEGELVEALGYLGTCQDCHLEATTAACIRCGRDHGTAHEPALVEGLIQAEPTATRHGPAPPPRAPFVRVEDLDA
jgi:DNA-binding transcriptional MerR regulator